MMRHDRVPAQETPLLPLSDDVPLAYLEPAEPDGERRQLYVLDTPDLVDKYVVRGMKYEDMSGERPLTLEDQYALYGPELSKLRQAGVMVPEVRAALPAGWGTGLRGGPVWRCIQADVMLVAERIDDVDVESCDLLEAYSQARMTLRGIGAYLEHAARAKPSDHIPAAYLWDILRADQYVFGTPTGRDAPGFYMVDIGANMEAYGRPYPLLKQDMCDYLLYTASWMDGLVRTDSRQTNLEAIAEQAIQNVPTAVYGGPTGSNHLKQV